MNQADGAAALQRAYYERTAGNYKTLHDAGHTPHDRGLEVILPHLHSLAVSSLLDVGAGTGRALRFLQARTTGIELRGLEPSSALIRQAEDEGVAPGTIVEGSGLALPFADDAFDVVTCFGVLHHVPQPAQVIIEMTRVARRAVFISDSNRFAQGRPLMRYAKLALHAVGLWSAFDFVRTRGRGYMISEGDGLFYSYSVFDSLRLLRAWTPELMLVELECAPRVAGAWAGPLCNASTILVGAIRKPDPA
jgi:SAM-dependent methyltransferase